MERQLASLATRDIAGPAWRDFGSVIVVEDRDAAVAVADVIAPEHLEVHTDDDDFYLESLSNYGSLFIGPWSTVAYSDKGIAGTNHVLPTGKTARYNAGLSVSRFLKPLTYQRAAKEGTAALAPAVERISAFEGLAAHGATATLRIDRIGRTSGAFDDVPTALREQL
ncbi:histidinol dehydrogenase [Streptomyces ambofaciens]